MSEELLPCPFCGTKPVWHPQGNEWTKSRKLILKCPECRVQISNGAMRNSMDWLYQITAEAWNRRTLENAK